MTDDTAMMMGVVVLDKVREVASERIMLFVSVILIWSSWSESPNEVTSTSNDFDVVSA